jgi:hypothetical protein
MNTRPLVKVEEIAIMGEQMPPCDFDCCKLDATVMVTAPNTLRDNRQVETYDKPTPLCTGHAHVIVAEAMVGL